MKTLDQVIQELTSLRDIHGGDIGVSVFNSGDGCCDSYGETVLEKDVTLDYKDTFQEFIVIYPIQGSC
jgi:hypothetical protein